MISIIVFVLLAVTIGYAYRSSLSVPWHFDDKQNIIDNPYIQIMSLSWEELRGVMEGGAISGVLRQTAYLGFALNFYISSKTSGGGFDPTIWHFVNIVIHILTSYLIFLLSFDILKRTRSGWDMRSRLWISIVAALLFALNPIQSQTVIYIVQRLASLAAFWYLLTLILYIKHRTIERRMIPFLGNFPLLIWVFFLGFSGYYIWRSIFDKPSGTVYALMFYIGAAVLGSVIVCILSRKSLIKRQDGGLYLIFAIISGMIAITTKENAITLPFACWLYDYLFISGNDKSFKVRSFFGWGVVGLFLLIVSPILSSSIMVTYESRDFTIGERLLTQFRVIWSYLYKMIYPHPGILNLDIEVEKSTSLIKPIITLPAILLTVLAVSGSIWYLRKDKLIPFLVLWYFGQLVIESSFIGLEMAFEHRFYLPGWGPVLLVSIAIFRIFEKISNGMQLVKPDIMKYSLSSILILIVGIQSILWIDARTQVWASEINLWKDIVEKSPGKVRPKVNLGFIYVEEAGRIESVMVNAMNRGDFAEGERLKAQAMKYYSDAEKSYRDALKIDPESTYALINLGHLFLLRQDFQGALDIFHEAEKADPDDPTLHFNLGVTYKELGAIAQARNHYHKALEVRPNYYQVLNNLGILEIQEGNFDEAIRVFSEATQVNRSPALAWYNLGNVYAKMAQEIEMTKGESYHEYNEALDKAEECYRNSLRFHPNYLQATVNLANVLSMNKKFDEAIESFSKALEIDPYHINTHYNLGLIYMLDLNRPDDALFHFQNVLKINPNISKVKEIESYIRQLREGNYEPQTENSDND